MDYKVGVSGGFAETRKGGDNAWASTPPKVARSVHPLSLLTLPQPFFSSVPGRYYFTLTPLKSSNSDASTLEKSSGSIKMSQMSKVKEQTKQTAQAPRSAERNLGLTEDTSKTPAC